MSSPTSLDPEVAAIRDVAAAWTVAVERGDLEALASLVSDDIVVVHGNGRCVVGREAVVADFAAAFERYQIRQRVASEETVAAGCWAFDRARVESTVVSLESGVRQDVSSHTWTLLRKKAGAWTVARVIGVKDETSGER